ncbi:hypothetical protein NDU88_003133, partial [Pleurodeles waltl]
MGAPVEDSLENGGKAIPGQIGESAYNAEDKASISDISEHSVEVIKEGGNDKFKDQSHSGDENTGSLRDSCMRSSFGSVLIDASSLDGRDETLIPEVPGTDASLMVRMKRPQQETKATAGLGACPKSDYTAISGLEGHLLGERESWVFNHTEETTLEVKYQGIMAYCEEPGQIVGGLKLLIGSCKGPFVRLLKSVQSFPKERQR